MLKRVSIQNFKSLKDVTLDLQKVNLLIGPNNSGKTNFLKALELTNTLGDTKDYFDQNVLFKKQLIEPSIYFIFNKIMLFDTDQDYYHYKLFIDLNHIFHGDKLSIKIKFGSSQNINTLPIDFEENFIEGKSNPFLKTLKIALGDTFIYKPDPNKLTQPGPVGTHEEFVNADASNLIGFLDRMLGNQYRKLVFNRIEADLHSCVPEFDEINLDDAQPIRELKALFPHNSFKRLGLTDGKQGVTYWADELSEGTLYFIALLCIINQPNPPKLLLLEEPEKGIHPRRIHEVIQFIFGLVDDKDIQVIMTTHSPVVVDMFKDMPESVFIFDKDEEGATHVKNLQRDIIEPETAESKKSGFDPPRYLDGLGDAWTVGFLGGVPR